MGYFGGFCVEVRDGSIPKSVYELFTVLLFE
jgi:hypothetical protein